MKADGSSSPDGLKAPGVSSDEELLDYSATRIIKRQLLSELEGKDDSGYGVEDVLGRWPVEPKNDADFASVLFVDYCRRQHQSGAPSIEEYRQKFPEHEGSLNDLMQMHSVMRSLSMSKPGGATLRLPVVGEELFGFHLCGELGKGAFARVFLSKQAELAGRRVALKVSAIEGDEPQLLAQLQHTNIVPIYSVHEDRAAGLRAVCMPFFGANSLSGLIKNLWERGSAPRHGRDFVQALERGSQAVQSSNAAALPDEAAKVTNRSILSKLESFTYDQVAAWIVARLADGLQHAHERGILHRDIKPSNVLIGDDGQPMLLDFNLSHDTQSVAQATLGGTVSYMAPEHLRALMGRDSNIAGRVGRPADIYSLGMVLFEMLAGASPFQQSASYTPLPMLVEAMAVERSQSVPSLRKDRPQTSWNLEGILCKCLAPNPQERYQTAEQLAEDLDRFLSDRPLRYAPELSRTERMRKWIRRHPRLTSAGSVATAACVLLAILGAAFVSLQDHLHTTTENLVASEALKKQQDFDKGALDALCLVNTVSDIEDHRRLGAQKCRETLALYHVLDRQDWQRDPDWLRVPPDSRHELAEQTRELLLLLAWATARDVRTPTTLQEALSLLDRAEEIDGLAESRALWHDRSLLLSQAGRQAEAAAALARAQTILPSSARDHYLMATILIRDPASTDETNQTEVRTRAYLDALAHLDKAAELNPRHYWTYVQRGICHLDLGQVDLAAADFAVCQGLWPEFAWSYFNQAVCWNRLGHKDKALADYDAAIKRDPKFIEAWLNRGLVHLETQKYELALADFDEAARLGYDGPGVHGGRGGALEALGHVQEADRAFDTAVQKAALLTGPQGREVRTNLLLQRAFAVSTRNPEKARSAFQEILRDQPNHAQALYGSAMLLVQRGETAEALECFDHAIEALPNFIEAYRYRAILLARQKEFYKAGVDINWCLDKEPTSGPTLYAAACVSALVAQFTDDVASKKDAADQALRMLKLAFDKGYGRKQAANDPDLAGISSSAAFREVMDAGQEVSVAYP